MSFNQWAPKSLYNAEGSPVYSSAKTPGTKFAIEHLEKTRKRVVIDEKTGEKKLLMPIPPPLPKWRGER